MRTIDVPPPIAENLHKWAQTRRKLGKTFIKSCIPHTKAYIWKLDEDSATGKVATPVFLFGPFHLSGSSLVRNNYRFFRSLPYSTRRFVKTRRRKTFSTNSSGGIQKRECTTERCAADSNFEHFTLRMVRRHTRCLIILY